MSRIRRWLRKYEWDCYNLYGDRKYSIDLPASRIMFVPFKYEKLSKSQLQKDFLNLSDKVNDIAKL
ncbi:hypothetical protein HCH_03581 [Hahella chejuensis KCTC 2396]|uniref:Uncharacterized protein n=1 Tax=Hahella chejuensis (strain KCTC 2396) TaxID=349521 RepID=Q2SGA1_HAHCH|nr:hypothetical protein [Hahella chejuensis]ABC30323.1 hypothetical protein HCH_03581 [Hahella chejuensis KCTC 2396]